MTPEQSKVAATFIVHRAGDMTKRGRREIAAWLRRQAADLEELGKDYAKRMTARYYVRSK